MAPSADYPVPQARAAMPQPALRCCREWLPRGSKPKGWLFPRPCVGNSWRACGTHRRGVPKVSPPVLI